MNRKNMKSQMTKVSLQTMQMTSCKKRLIAKVQILTMVYGTKLNEKTSLKECEYMERSGLKLV